MNCLNETDLQKYLDRELPDEILMNTEKHLGSCPICDKHFRIAMETQLQVIHFLNEIQSGEPPIVIPDFQINRRKPVIKKILVIASIAASILFIIGIGSRINNQKSTRKQLENITKARYEITRNTDPNKMLHQKQIIMVVTDASGNVIETSFEE